MKRVKILLVLLVAALVALTAAACASPTQSGDYKYNTNLIDYKAECDADTVIDGRLTEERWKDLAWQSHILSDVSVRVTTSFSDTGVYVAAIVKDTNLFYNAPYSLERNSGIRIYIAREDDYELKERVTAYFDVGNTPFKTGVYKCAYCVTVQGERVNTRRSEGFTLEAYFPWEELKLEEKPENVRLTWYYNVKKNAGASPTSVYAGLTDGAHLGKFWSFGENGYLEGGDDDSMFGDSIDGLSKSAEWKEIHEKDGSVTLNSNASGQRVANPGGRYVFFKRAAAESYMFSGVIKPNYIDGMGADIASGAPRLGIMAAFDSFNGMAGAYIDYRTSFIDTNRVTFGPQTLYNGIWDRGGSGEWFDSNNSLDAQVIDRLGINMREGLPFTVVKNGARIYYFLGRGDNCYFIKAEEQTLIEGEVTFGFYSYGADVNITEIEYSVLNDFDGDSSVVNQSVKDILKDKSVYNVKVNQATSGGGYIQSDSVAERYGNGFSITVNQNSNKKVLSSLKVKIGDADEVEYISTIDAEMTNGVFTFDGFNDDVVITPTFSDAECLTFSGTVILDGKALSSGTVFAEDKNRGSRRYTVAVSDGKFSDELPKGEYRATFYAPFSSTVYADVNLTTANATQQAALTSLPVGGEVYVGNNKLESSIAWITRPGGKIVKPMSTSQSACVWFRNSGNDTDFIASAVMEILSATDSDPNGGLVISDGSTKIEISLLHDGYRINNGDWASRHQKRAEGTLRVVDIRNAGAKVKIILEKRGTEYKLYGANPDGSNQKLLHTFYGSLKATQSEGNGAEWTVPTGKVAVGLSFRNGAEVAYSDFEYTAL